MRVTLEEKRSRWAILDWEMKGNGEEDLGMIGLDQGIRESEIFNSREIRGEKKIENVFPPCKRVWL